MVRKLERARGPRRKMRDTPPYRSLAQGQRPEERLASLLTEARQRGLKPMTEEDLDAMADAWPENESIDDFLEWRRQSRREGRK